MADDTSDFQLCPDPSTLSLEPLLNIPAPRSVVTCIARRGAGKSFLFSSWLYHQLRDPKRMYNKGNVIVFTSSGRLSNDFSYLSPENVRPFSEQTFTSVMRLQQRRITLLKKRAERSNTSCTLPPLLVCLDDPQGMSHRSTDGGKGAFHSNAVSFAYTCGRHLKLQLWCSIQNPTSLLSTAARSQTTHLVMASLSQEQLRACYKLIDGVASFQQFARMIASLKPYCFLLFDTTRPAGERFQYIRASGFNDGRWKVRIAQPPSSKKGKQNTKDKETHAANAKCSVAQHEP
jgi:hypothetical protein